MKKVFFLVFFVFVFGFSNNTFANKYCETNTLYPLYQCRNENICTQYKPTTILYDNMADGDYEEMPANAKFKDKMLTNAKEKYVESMNNIYVCATIKIRISALNEITKLLLKINMAKEVEEVIGDRFKIMKIEAENEFNTMLCKGINSNSTYSKITVLKQGTWEMCKYRNYLEYLIETNTYIVNLKEELDESIPIASIIKLKDLKDDEIRKEIEHIYKVFPVAFHAYSGYENNFIVHLYLQLIKADFIVLRQKLHEALGPINQVPYKILNAMSL